MADPTTVTQQIVSESPAVEAYKLNLLQNASNLANNVGGTSLAKQLPNYQVAGFDPNQTKALNAATSTGVGSFAPYINTAQQYLGQGAATTGEAADIVRGADTRNQFTDAQGAMQNAGSAASNIGSGMPYLGAAGATYGAGVSQVGQGLGQYDPNSAAAFMNPYTQQALQGQLGEMNRQSQIQQQANTSQATKAGAFGGDRAQVQQAETQRNNSQLQNQAIANAYNQNYTQAQTAAMQAYEQGQQRDLAAGTALGNLGQGIGNLAGQQGNIYAQQAGAQQAIGTGIGSLAAQQYGIGQNMASTLGTLGGQMGNVGVQQAALGQTAQTMNQNDINMLYNAGQAQQGQSQAQLDATRANTLQQVYAPYQQAGFLSDIYKGAPSSQMATTASSTATPSPFVQAAGAIGSGVVAASGAKKAGLF